MRAVVQRVHRASVTLNGATHAAIGSGLHVYVGVDRSDQEPDAAFLADKVAHLRVFPDDQGRLNLDVGAAGGRVLVVSAFTVCADARHGRRPSFDSAASGDAARSLYEVFCDRLRGHGVDVATGVFGADMLVETVNDGPVCVLLDSRRAF